MNKYYSVLSILLFTGLSSQVLAGPCDAHYRFDGNLGDAAGGQAGQMIGPDGAQATAQFVEGRSGQALKLDGSSAMRAFVDLNRDRCPQVTVTAWVRVEPAPSQTILGTGTGRGPWLYASGSLLSLRTANQDLRVRDAIYANSGWMFIAAVWDHSNETHRLYWRGRQSEGAIGTSSQQALPAIWIGAMNDALHHPAKDLVIDELRIIGRALDTERIMAMRDAPAGAGEAQSAAAGTAGQACSSPAGCPAGMYCGMDRTCHPDSHRPMQSSSGGTTLQDLQASSAERNADAVGTIDYDAPTDLLEGAGSGDDGGTTLADLQEQAAERNADRIGDIDYQSPTDVLEEARAADEERSANAPDEEPQTQNGFLSHLYRLQFSTDVLAFSGVSGGAGDYTEQAIETAFGWRLPYWIETRENYDKPCTVYVHSRAIRTGFGQPPEPYTKEFDVCEEGLPRINPLTTLHREIVEPSAGEFGLMTGIQVCNNGINKRVKGIRARVRGYTLPGGTYSPSYTTRVFQERSHCVSWDDMAHCPANTYAIGLRLHFRDGDVVSPRDFLSGLELVCTDMQLMRSESPAGPWEPVRPGG